MTKTLILSLLSALTLAACIADPSDDLGHSRDLRADGTHGNMYDGLDQDEGAPSIDDATHGALDETLDTAQADDDDDDVTAMPQTLTLAR